MDGDRYRGLIFSIALIIVALAFVFIGLYVMNIYLDIVPGNFERFIYAGVIALFIFVIIRIIVKGLESYFSKYVSPARFRPLIFIISLLGYFIMSLAVFASLGIDVSSIILGSTFLSLILGLASQNVLSNIFGGLMVVFAKPFVEGDEIAINTWQFGMMLSSYPPKYFSRDEIRPSYSGMVTRIDLLYTTIRDRSGKKIKIPNSIIVQGAIEKMNQIYTVRVRYEIPKDIVFQTLEPALVEEISNIDGASGMPKILIDETTLNTYVITVDAEFKTSSPDEKKSEVLKRLMGRIEPLKKRAN
jgi:small-conductance mechanosensitive channel